MQKQQHRLVSPSEAAVTAPPLAHLEQVLAGQQSAESEPRSLGLDGQQPILALILFLKQKSAGAIL